MRILESADDLEGHPDQVPAFKADLKDTLVEMRKQMLEMEFANTPATQETAGQFFRCVVFTASSCLRAGFRVYGLGFRVSTLNNSQTLDPCKTTAPATPVAFVRTACAIELLPC